MQKADRVLRKMVQPQFVVHFGRGLQIGLFGLFDQRIHDVNLTAEFDLAFDAVIDPLPFVFTDHDRFDRRPAGRHFVDQRHVEVAVNGHRQRPRYGRRGHDENVGIHPAGF